MVKVYRALSWAIVALVAVQAASIAWFASGEARYVENGGVVDKALVEAAAAGGEMPFPEVLGIPIHGLNGGILIPLVALALLACSFAVRFPRARAWAGIVLLIVAVQHSLGFAAGDLPALGLLHGANALLLAGAALRASRLPAGQQVGEPVMVDDGVTR